MTRFSIAGLTLVVLFASGCFCLKPWQKFDMAKAPDSSCFEGGTHGWEIFVWDCVDGKHVVVGQFSAEMTCQAAIQQTAPCGERTQLEVEEVDTGKCKLAPDTRWRR